MASDYDIARAAAAVYAESLLQLANETGRTEEIGQELAELKDLWDRETAFSEMMSSAAIDDDARKESIKKAFGSGRVDPMVLNMMQVLNDKRRAGILPLVCESYRHKVDKQVGREDVFVTSATALADEQRNKIESEVKRLTGHDAILVETVDPDVLGGVKIQVADRLFDMTLRRRLNDMSAGLLASSDEHLRTGASRFVTEG